MVRFLLHAFLLLAIVRASASTVETLHFDSACLQTSNLVQLHLRCSQYEHIQIVRVIYGYTKQPSLKDCQFSIYDCIQEGASHNILACNGKQTCPINLSKNEMLSSTVMSNGVPICPDFNYVQVNYACIPDSQDVCDSWKDEGPTIHISHTYSKERQFNRCHCKVRSSMSTGQVLLHAREINRQYGSFKSLMFPQGSDSDCKKTTYVEIATDRAERKCMDMFPSNGNALFGSGSHNFSVTYVKNDPFSELFFYFELKASPVKKDHNVQIICNWARRSTTTAAATTSTASPTDPIISTTIPIVRKRKTTTMSMERGSKLSRLDLIRRRPPTDEPDDTTTPVVPDEDEPVDEAQYDLTTTVTIPPVRTKKTKSRRSTTSRSRSTSSSPISTSPLTSTSSNDDEEWIRILSLASLESPSPSKQLISINNRSYVTAAQASIITNEKKTRPSSSTSNLLLISLLAMVTLTIISLLIYCLKVKRPDCLQRLKLNTNVALLFCCEAGKLLFCSSNRSHSIASSPTSSSLGTTRRPRRSRRRRPSSNMPDYQSSEYYMNETGNNARSTQSIYEAGKSIYSIDYDEEETEYTTKYDRHHEAGSC